jgi:hypothetical protein
MRGGAGCKPWELTQTSYGERRSWQQLTRLYTRTEPMGTRAPIEMESHGSVAYSVEWQKLLRLPSMQLDAAREAAWVVLIDADRRGKDEDGGKGGGEGGCGTASTGAVSSRVRAASTLFGRARLGRTSYTPPMCPNGVVASVSALCTPRSAR